MIRETGSAFRRRSSSFSRRSGVLVVEGPVHHEFGVPLDGGHRHVEFRQRAAVEPPRSELRDGGLHLRFEVRREPRRGVELGGVGDLVERDPPAEPVEIDVQRVGDGDDVRVDEIEAVVALAEQDRVVLPEDVVREKPERHGHRPGVGRPGDRRDDRDLPFERGEQPAERLHVRVDPVVAVLDLDGSREVETDPRRGPDVRSRVSDVGGVALAVGLGQRQFPGAGPGAGCSPDGGPVDGTVTLGFGDCAGGTKEIHSGRTRPGTKGLPAVETRRSTL